MTDLNELRQRAENLLGEFTLIEGAGSKVRRTACAMSLLCMVDDPYGEFTDKPDCAHPVLNSIVISANDSGISEELKATLVRAGVTGVLDTWWIPSIVIAKVQAEMNTINPDVLNNRYNRAIVALDFISKWKENREKIVSLRYDDLNGANLQGLDLRGVDLMGADLRFARLRYTMLHDANLRNAKMDCVSLKYTYGSRGTLLPDGYKVNESGLIVCTDR